GGGFPVGDGFAVFEFAFGHVPAVGVDGRGQGRGGLRDRRGRFGNDRRGVRRRFERFVRAFAFAARVAGNDPEVVGRVRREARARRGDFDGARPRPRQRGAGGGFAVGDGFAVFEFAFGHVPAVGVDGRGQGRGGLRDRRSRFGNDRRGVRRRFERFVRAFAFAARVAGNDPEVVGRVRREARDRRGDFDGARPRPRQRGAGGGFAVGDGFAVFEFAFGHVPAVGVDGRGQGRGGLRDRRGRFGNDRRGVRQRFERFVRALARAARIRRGDSEVVGRVRRETRDRCGHGDRARPRPRQRGAGGGFAVGGRFAVFEFAFFDVPAVRVDRRVQCHRGLRDGRGGLRFDRRGA